MAVEDWIDIYGDPDDDEFGVVECNRCGRNDLSWEQCNGKWRLCTPTGRIHRCGMRASKNEFAKLGDAE